MTEAFSKHRIRLAKVGRSPTYRLARRAALFALTVAACSLGWLVLRSEAPAREEARSSPAPADAIVGRLMPVPDWTVDPKPPAPPRSTSPLEPNEEAAAPARVNVTGVVTDALGGPINGALVVARELDSWEPVIATLSGSAGRFEMALGHPVVELRATAPAYTSQMLQVNVPCHGLILTLAPASSIRGSVVSHSGEPVAGAEVAARAESASGPAHPSTTTNDAGDFELDQLSPGRYELLAIADRWRTRTEWVSVSMAEAVGPVVLHAEQATSLTASITLDGEPCRRGMIQLHGPLEQARAILTDGKVHFPGLHPGHYAASISCWPLSSAASTRGFAGAQLQEPASMEDVIEIGSDPIARHWALVSEEQEPRPTGTIRAILEGDPARVKRSQVRLRRGLDEAVWGERVGFVTDFKDLPLDHYDVYLEETPNVRHRVLLESDGQLVELRLPVPGERLSIEGRVLEAGVGVVDAWVTAVAADTPSGEEAPLGSPVLTDETGWFVLNDLPEGVYDIGATSPAGTAIARGVRGGQSSVELLIQAQVLVTGWVATESGEPVASFLVKYQRQGESRVNSVQGGRGVWSAPWVASASYSLRIYSEAGCYTQTVELQPGTRHEVRSTVKPDACVSAGAITSE